MSELPKGINERLASLSSTSICPFIFKINEQLRRQNKKAYEPEILGVGPYHRGKVRLQMMEVHKLRYLDGLLKRRNASVDGYVEALKNLEVEPWKCYAEHIKLNEDKFVEMMLLDGCFIIELFRKSKNPTLIDEHDPIFHIPKILKSIQRDLLLFENQIPLSVLIELFVMTEYSKPPNPENILVHLALDFFGTTISNLTPPQTSNNLSKIRINKNNHFLGLVHDTWCSSIAAKVHSRRIETNHGFIKCVTKVLKSVIESMKFKKSSLSHDVDPQNVSSHGIDTNHECIEGVTESLKSSPLLDNEFENVPSPGIDATQELKEDVTVLLQSSSLIDNEFENVSSCGIDTNQELLIGNEFEILPSGAIDRKEFRESFTEPTKSSSSQYIDLENVSFHGIETNHEFIKSVTELREVGIKFKKGTDTNHGFIKCVTKVLKSVIESIKFKKSSSSHDIDLKNVSSHGIDTNHESIKSVTELQETGNKSRKIECSSLLDIKFANGIMEIPALQVDDDTEWLFRNLIAYEQYSGGTVKAYMTEYTKFMDCLINSPKDVEILRHSGIIDNWLGDDKVVSTMFNKMGNHVDVNLDPEEFYYGKVFKEVNEYCKHRRHGWMAFLRYNYCNSPWSILSVIVASVFLLLTVIQTGWSILQD